MCYSTRLMRNRAERRWRRDIKAWRRIKEDRRQHGADRWCSCFGDPDPHVWGRTFSRFADTPKLCSCYMCGNPRRFGFLTLDEQRADADFRDQLADDLDWRDGLSLLWEVDE